MDRTEYGPALIAQTRVSRYVLELASSTWKNHHACHMQFDKWRYNRIELKYHDELGEYRAAAEIGVGNGSEAGRALGPVPHRGG